MVHDPGGAPISYDPTTRTLTRHAREDGEFVQAVLPESYGNDAWLIAAGPDDVVYLNLVVRPGAEGSADLVAVALAGGDAGREIERAVGSGNSGYDSDFVVTPDGLVTTDWYGQGQRPAADRSIVMRWVDRDADDDDSPVSGADPDPNGVRSITIDAYESTVTVNGRTWQLTGRAADIQPTGMPPIVGTFDGGFVARYDQVFDAYDSVVVRGWPDGTVDEWVVAGGPNGPGWSIIPEPMGTVLVGGGDTFARIAPFEARPPHWSGHLDIDVETGEARFDELNDYLTTLESGISQPPWDTDPVAFADAVAGPLSSPAELRTINHIKTDAEQEIVTVTDERFLDDSVYATRLTITMTSNLRGVDTITWLNSCQPNRGHQDYQSAYCT